MFKKLKALTIVSLLMMAGTLWLTKLKYNDFDVLTNGSEVIVNIIDVPTRCGEGSRSNKARFRFNYLGQVHVKNFKGLHCEDIFNGGTFTLLTDSDHSVFLFKDEGQEIKSDIAAGIALASMFGVLPS